MAGDDSTPPAPATAPPPQQFDAHVAASGGDDEADDEVTDTDEAPAAAAGRAGAGVAGSAVVPLNPNLTPSAIAEESRRLFQRLWTDEEELIILRGFLEFTSRRGTLFASHQHDTGPYYDEMRRALGFDFTKNQLIEKLRRLKKKYRAAAHRMTTATPVTPFAFKSAHERAIYDIAKNIWRAGVKRADGKDSDDDDVDPSVAADQTNVGAADGNGTRPRRRRRKNEEYCAGINAGENSVPVTIRVENSLPMAAARGVIEQTMRSCLTPLFKEMIGSVIGAAPLGMGLGAAEGKFLGFGVGDIAPTKTDGVVVDDEKWRRQRVLELEVYAKRLELIKEQVVLTLEELKSSSSGD